MSTINAARRRAGIGTLVMLIPGLGLLTLLVLVPAAVTPIVSFLRINLLKGTASFAGLDNWAAEIGNSELLVGTGNTLLYAIITVPISLALGMGCALAINSIGFTRGFWRTALFLPTAATLVAMAVAWKVMLSTGGPVDVLLRSVTGVSDWLSNYQLAMPAVAIVGIWQQFGYSTVLFAAGLSTVPAEPLEAAILDGANAWQRFWRVTLPMMGPSIVFAVVTATMTALRAFDQIQVMTGGGPGDSTRTLTFMLYARGLSYLDLGGAAVLATAMLALVIVITIWQVTRLRRLEENGAVR